MIDKSLDETIKRITAEAIEASLAIIEGTVREHFEARAETPQSIPSEREEIVKWLRSHDGADQRAIQNGECVRGSTMHGELRDRAGYYLEVADAIERGEHLTRQAGDVPTIAANLTTLERELLSGKASGWGSWMFECAAGLAGKGLAVQEGGSYRWSPLGQRVANYLNRDAL